MAGCARHTLSYQYVLITEGPPHGSRDGIRPGALRPLRLPAELPDEPHRVRVLLPLQVDGRLLQDPDRTREVPAPHLQVEEPVPGPLHLVVQERWEDLHDRPRRAVRELGRGLVLPPPEGLASLADELVRLPHVELEHAAVLREPLRAPEGLLCAMVAARDLLELLPGRVRPVRGRHEVPGFQVRDRLVEESLDAPDARAARLRLLEVAEEGLDPRRDLARERSLEGHLRLGDEGDRAV